MLITFLFRLNPSDGEVDQLRKEIDEDESGDVDFEEFLELMNSTTLRYVLGSCHGGGHVDGGGLITNLLWGPLKGERRGGGGVAGGPTFNGKCH